MYNQLRADPLSELKKLQTNIVDKLQVLGNLNTEYRNKQQKQFLKIFLHVMDKMSNELSIAQEQYQNIDREIEKDEKCLELSTKLLFFKNQSYYLKEELEKTEHQLKQERRKQKQLMKDKQMLQSNLFQKAKQIYKYRVKAKSQQKQMGVTTETNELSKIAERKPVSKKYSNTQTKNTNMSYFTNTNKGSTEKESPSPRNISSSEIDFRIKAAKMAKQRKMLINKTYYNNSKSKASRENLENLRIKG